MSKANKNALRITMRDSLKQLTAADRSVKSATVCERVATLPEFINANVVLLYLNMPGELSVHDVARAGWATGKTILAPRVDVPTRHMDAIELADFDATAPGAYNIPEPIGEPFDVSRIDLVIVPGVAFDRQGHRLGQGAGFYDRFLSRAGGTARTVAVGFAEQVVEVVPTDVTDWPMDVIVTDTDMIRPNPAE
jgi:5-formyltetrahydrofolate cyclo-ligase